MSRLLAALLVIAALCSARDAARADPERATLHVIVALVDNATQGIVPVPARIGNGNDPAENLYWGASLGVKSFLSKAPGWRRENCVLNVSRIILERCSFTLDQRLAVVADAWRGVSIADAMTQFMKEAATPPQGGRREMVLFVGHNGLMDAQNALLASGFPTHAPHTRSAGVLSCLSDRYFGPALAAAGVQTAVTTFSLMAPEAYVVEAIARVFAENGDETAMRKAAGAAYARYQKISPRAGAGVFLGRQTRASGSPSFPISPAGPGKPKER
ncbi:MAG: hypothetical protein FWD68_12925 [Alphaproteobacteria bacterium]|nr:hypothetical protein [Alphaproteobacteria bacterium]